jgi:DNA-binding CsgD family transcriptional regulator
MSLENLQDSANIGSNAIFESRRRSVVASYSGGLIEFRLHDALAREQALVREKGELIYKLFAWAEAAATKIAGLTPRERQVMELVLAGHPSKNIAADLSISQRTVENHRASIMKKTGTKSLPGLARLAFVADWISADEPGANGNYLKSGALNPPLGA